MPVAIIVAVAVAVAGFGLLGSVFLLTGQPDQAVVRVNESGNLEVRPIGMMRFWAMSNGIELPGTAVTAVTVIDQDGERSVRTLGSRKGWRPKGARMPGSYWPGAICAGTYRWKGVKELWMVTRATRALAIDLQGQRYTRVIVQVADPDATAAELGGLVHPAGSPS